MRLVRHEDKEDGALLALIVRRDREALEALYDRYGNAVFSLSMRMLRDSGASEEVTQDVFFNVWRRASGYHAGRGSVTAWLFSIAHHRTIDELRRRRRRQTQVHEGIDPADLPADDSNDPMEYATSQFEYGQVKDALHSLRPEQREVVMLAYFGGLTHSEIAAKLRQPLGTVKTRMRLALKKLREMLGPQIRESADHGL